MHTLFWITLLLLFYTYFGYGLLLLFFNALFKRKAVAAESQLPAVTFVVPAYNEEDVILEKIESTLSLDYPADRISFVFVTDGSTDKTPEIVRRYSSINALHQPRREGKSAAINRAMQTVQTPIVVFSDANAMIHPQSIRRMVRHYADGTVGGVSGEKRIASNRFSSVSFGEQLYWQYESLLKKAAGDFYTIVGAAGELFSIRTGLFRPLDKNTVLDDFVLSVNVCLQGHRFLYEAAAFCTETASASFREEQKRKVRISAGCYQALIRLPQLLNPFKNFRLAFQYLSHRVLRWTVCPLALPLLLLSNSFLFLTNEGGVYAFFFWAQCGFYLFALAGRAMTAKKPVPKFLLIPYYFVFMIFAQYAGLYRFVRRRQPALWEKVRRQPRPRH